jgi:hypothetical protein
MQKAIVKKYRPLALLFVLIVAILGMSRYAETRKKKHQDDTSHIQRGATITPDKASEGTKETDKTEDSPSWIDTFTWPDGVTMWALLLTLFVIAWQSTETRDAANAANAQIKMMKEKDRARLAITPGGFSPYWSVRLESSLEISHFGPSEAFSISGVYSIVVTNSSDIPKWEVWPIERTSGQQLPSVIKPGSGPIVISCSIPFGNKEHDAVENGTGFLHFFGRLCYIDIYGEQRVTPFRYICEPQGGGVQVEWHERRWVRHGPESDNIPK